MRKITKNLATIFLAIGILGIVINKWYFKNEITYALLDCFVYVGLLLGINLKKGKWKPLKYAWAVLLTLLFISALYDRITSI